MSSNYEIKEDIINDIKRRLADDILEKTNFDLLKKLEENADYKNTEDIINDIKRRLADVILEIANFDLLKRLVENASSLSDAIQIAELGTLYKRTGFHFDPKLEKGRATDTITYFKKNEELSFETDKNALTHKLIIGDNYPALLNLLIEHRRKIDVIYIDPPYGKDNMGDFAKTNYENAITRNHLLSMLYPRLFLAKHLLSDSGVVFCSIDDRNQAYVKCLFDEVFEESNCLLEMCVNRPSEIATNYTINKHEYCLVYVKNINLFNLNSVEKFTESRGTVGNANQTMPIIEFPAGLECKNIPDGIYKETRKVTNSSENIENFDPIVVKNGRLKNPIKLKARWRSSNDMRNFFKNNCQPTPAKINGVIVEIFFKDDKFNPWIKKETCEKIPSLFLDNKRGSADLNEIGLENLFDFPKSVSFIKYLFTFAAKDAVFLDFFAGTGTTGQAVLELNKDDDGKRQFILVTNNEITDKTPNGIAFDVTSKRLKRVMTGKCYDGVSDFNWVKENEPLGDNLLVLKIDDIANFESTEGKTPFDVIDETLYGKERFATIKEKTEWVCDNFEITQNTGGVKKDDEKC